jgi:hypothetical protein
MAAIFTVTQQLSESVVVWATRLDAFLSSLGACSIQDLDVIYREGQTRAQLVAAVTYISPGSSLIRAQAFAGSGVTSAGALANAFLVANPTYRILYLRDVSDPQRRSLNTDVVLLVYSTDSLSNCAQGECTLTIVQAVADIAPGATGAALLVGASGATATTMTVENRSLLTWPAGGRGYAAPILGACTWAGVPTCCAAATTTTTTTTTSTTTTSTTSTTTTAPPSGAPSDLSGIVATGLGYVFGFPGGYECELQFQLLTPVAGQTVTLDFNSSEFDPAVVDRIETVSGLVPVDNLDGTWTYTFITGLETIHSIIVFDDYAEGNVSYTCAALTPPTVTGVFFISNELPT